MMKNKWVFAGTFFVAVGLCVMTACVSTQSADAPRTETVDGVTYTYCITNGVAVIGTGSPDKPAVPIDTKGALTIPSALGGHPVKAIGEYAFSGCEGLTAVTVPDTVETLELSAFWKCSGLISVVLPKSVKNIEHFAFADCSSLAAIIIPNNVTNIGCRAFQRCSSLTSITIPQSVISMEGAVDMCTACTNLKAINVDKDNAHFSSIDGVLFDKAGLRLLAYPYGKKGAYTIPDKVEIVEIGAFGWHDGLTALTIPSNVKEIKLGAFFSCTNLTSVVMNEGLQTIGNGVFVRCQRLTSVVIPKSVEKIGSGVFDSCSDLKAIAVHADNPNYKSVDGVLYTKDGSVLMSYPCAKQGDYSIPDGVKQLSYCSIRGNPGLTTLAIPATVERIGACVFEGCFNLSAINVDAGNPLYSSIDGVLFNKVDDRLLFYPRGKQGAYAVPNGIRSIRTRAFAESASLTEVTIPNSVTNIEDTVFTKCTNLTAITLPNTISTIGRLTFSRCSRLGTITIPDSVRNIGLCAFDDCVSLTTVIIPNSVTNIEKCAFAGCSNITSVVIPPCVTDLKKTFPSSYNKITNVVRHAATP